MPDDLDSLIAAAEDSNNVAEAVRLFSSAMENEDSQSAKVQLLLKRGRFYARRDDFKAGAADFRAAMDLDHQNTQAPLLLAHALIDGGEPKEAISLLNELIDGASPEGKTLHSLLFARALAYQRLHLYSKALIDIERAIVLFPDDTHARMHRARLLSIVQRHADALAEAQEVERLEPGKAPTIVLIAQCLESDGRLKDALEKLSELPEGKTDHFVAHFKGDLLRRLQRYDEARAVLQTELDKNPTSVHILSHLAEIAARQRKSNEAKDLWARLLSQGPSDDELLSAARMIGNAGLEEEALAAFEQVLSKRPDDPSAMFDYALSLANLNRTDEALRTITGLDLDKINDPDFDLLKARILIRLNRQSDAAAVVDNSRVAESQDSSTKLRRAQLLRQLGRYSESIGVIERLFEASPNDSELALELGESYSYASDYPHALVYFEKAVELMPASVHAKSHLAVTLIALRRLDEAILTLDQILESDPHDLTALANKAAILLKLNQPKEAEVLFGLATSIDPGRWNLLAGRALCLVRCGEFETAITLFNEAIRLGGTDSSMYAALAYALAEAGQLEKALDNLHKAIELGPKEAMNHYNAGVVLGKLGRDTEAITSYRQCLALDPKQSNAHLGVIKSLLVLGNLDEARNAGWDFLEQNEPTYQFWLLFGMTCSRLADLYHDSNLTNDAISHLNNGLGLLREQTLTKQRNEEESLFLLERAYAYSEVGKQTEARRDYVNAMQSAWKKDRKYRVAETNLARLSSQSVALEGVPKSLATPVSLLAFCIIGYACYALKASLLNAGAFASIIIVALVIIPVMYVLPFIQRLRLAGVELERSSVVDVATRFDQLQLPYLLDQLLGKMQHVELANWDVAVGFYFRYFE